MFCIKCNKNIEFFENFGTYKVYKCLDCRIRFDLNNNLCEDIFDIAENFSISFKNKIIYLRKGEIYLDSLELMDIESAKKMYFNILNNLIFM